MAVDFLNLTQGMINSTRALNSITPEMCVAKMKTVAESCMANYNKIDFVYVTMGAALFVAFNLRYTKINGYITKKKHSKFTETVDESGKKNTLVEVTYTDRFSPGFTKWFNLITEQMVTAGVLWTFVSAIYLATSWGWSNG